MKLFNRYQMSYSTLKKQKSGLMHDLLTGKVPVKTESATHGTAHV